MPKQLSWEDEIIIRYLWRLLIPIHEIAEIYRIPRWLVIDICTEPKELARAA